MTNPAAVYFMRNGLSNLYKIGKSNEPKRRVKQCRKEYGMPELNVEESIWFQSDEEAYLHEKLFHQKYENENIPIRRVDGGWSREFFELSNQSIRDLNNFIQESKKNRVRVIRKMEKTIPEPDYMFEMRKRNERDNFYFEFKWASLSALLIIGSLIQIMLSKRSRKSSHNNFAEGMIGLGVGIVQMIRHFIGMNTSRKLIIDSRLYDEYGLRIEDTRSIDLYDIRGMVKYEKIEDQENRDWFPRKIGAISDDYGMMDDPYDFVFDDEGRDVVGEYEDRWMYEEDLRREKLREQFKDDKLLISALDRLDQKDYN